MIIQNGNYEGGFEWEDTCTALGAGVTGKCYCGLDDKTEFKFCIKIVSYLFSDVLVYIYIYIYFQINNTILHNNELSFVYIFVT